MCGGSIHVPWGALVLLLACNSWAQEAHRWRYWSALDGLGESYCASVTVSSDGKVWVNHGDVNVMSVLNGYGVTNIPSPGRDVSVFESESGQIWSVDIDAFLEFRGGQWIRHPLSITLGDIPPFYPYAQDRILFLTAGVLYEYDVAADRSTSIKQMDETGLGRFIHITPARDGGLWISGEKGLALLTVPRGEPVSQSSWTEFPIDDELELYDFQQPIDCGDEGIFCVAVRRSTHKHVCLKLYDRSYQILSDDGFDAGRCWSVDGVGIWALDFPTQSLHRILETGEAVQIDDDRTAAVIHDVALSPDGSFWLGTSQGLVRYSPPLFRTTPDAPLLDVTVHSIYEDAHRRIWFACTNSLALLDGTSWKVYPFPVGMRSDYHDTQALSLLPDGRLVIQRRSNKQRMLIFNPDREVFEAIEHPGNRKVRSIAPRKDGTMWVQAGEENDYRIDVYDGIEFRTVLDMGANWNIQNLRHITETSNGDVWFGGTAGLALYRDGIYRVLGPDEGFHGDGAFCIEESFDGGVLIGDRNHIYEYKDGEFRVILSDIDKPRSILVASNGNLWIAAGDGLYRRDGNDWIAYTKADGLPVDITLEVFEDSWGRIWIGTARGFCLFDPNTDTDSPETFVHPDQNPSEVSSRGIARVVYSGIDRWDNTQSFRLLYSYCLDNGPWQPVTGNNDVPFKNLAYGKHHFEVRAMDRAGNLDSTPAVYDFIVLRPWYREPGFLAMGVCALISAAIAVYTAVMHTRKAKEERARHEREKQDLEEQIRQAQKMEAVGQLAGGLAHDFNNLLQVISGYTSMAKIGLPQESRRAQDLEQVSHAAEKAAKLTNQLLTFSRRKIIQPINLNLSQLTLEVSTMLRRVIGEDIEIALLCQNETMAVYADPGMIEQVLINLCMNARDAMPDGGRIVIETQNVIVTREDYETAPWVEPGRYVMLRVSDSGIGIAPEIHEHIFEPFFTTKKLSKGTGLGLATVYGVVKQHNGAIRVISEPGRGATFEICLPVSGRITQKDMRKNDAIPICKGTETVLIAEDEKGVRTFAARTLEENGYTVLQASDGNEAVELFERNADDISIVILDVVMPNLSGRGAYERIKRIRPDTHILFCSGYAPDSIHTGFILNEGLQLIQKPYEGAGLLHKVRGILDAK